MKNRISSSLVLFFIAAAFFLTVSPVKSFAKSAGEINASIETALTELYQKVPGSQDLAAKSKGVLVFPSVIKGGIVLGAEYGEGGLIMGGKVVEYYNTIGGSFGFQLGGQVKRVFLFFMEDQELRNFRNSDGWKAGVDASVALITIGANGSIDTSKTNQPIVGIVIGQKGLMYNATFEGAKYNRIAK